MTKDQILKEAMSLEPQERLEIAQALRLADLPGELSSEQLAEFRRRIAAVDSGEVMPIPGEEVMRELNHRFQR